MRVMRFAALLLIFLSFRSFAQDNPNLLTLAFPDLFGTQLDEAWFDDFEANHNVQIHLMDSPEDAFYSFSLGNHASELDKLEGLVTSADIILLDDQLLDLHASRSGYFLNIEPLVLADRELAIEDFYPPIWEAFVWDNGRWALPIAGSLQLWLYDTEAFDASGLAYPTPDWTMNDIAQTARALTQEVNGDTIPGLSESYEDVLLSTLLSGTDTANLSPDDLSILQSWAELRSEGAVGLVFSNEFQALYIGNIRELIPYTHTNPNLEAALLSDGQTGLISWGLAISSGTANAQLAYEFTKYLSEVPEFIQLFELPARQSIPFEYPNAIADLIEPAIANAIPRSRNLNIELFVDASHRAAEENLPIADALLLAEADWQSSLQAAESRAESPIVVEAPFLPVLAPDEILLRFGFDRGGWISVYNQEAWRDLSEAFAREHERVGFVDFDTDLGYDTGQWSQNYDCIYTQMNINSFNAESYLPLSPLMNADPNFLPADFLGTSLSQLEYQGQILAYPLMLFPKILTYDPTQLPFELDAGAWSVSEMLDILNSLKETGESPLALNEDIDMLIINFGGIPIDYRSNPPTVNLLDENNFNAIQQVLDLAKEGYLAYAALAPFDYAYSDALIRVSEFYPHMVDEYFDWGIKPFPTGIQYNAASYQIGAIYISAQSLYAEECYEFAKTIEAHPEALMGMPARASSVELAVMNNYYRANLSSLYADYADLLQAPTTVIIPRMSEGGKIFLSRWFCPIGYIVLMTIMCWKGRICVLS